MPRLQYTKGVAGTLEFYAPEGIPDSSASLTIYTSGTSELTGSWPATVTLTSATTTLSSAASRYAESVAVVDGSSFVVGQRYTINDNGQLLEVRISRIDSNTLYLDQPLSFDVASGATIASHRYTYSLTTTHTANLRRRLRAVWSYDVDSIAHAHHQYFSIVNEPFTISLSEEEIEAHDLAFGEYADPNGAWKKLIGGAHDEIERMLRSRQLSPDLIRDRDGLKDALIFCFLSKFYGSAPGQRERADMWLERCVNTVAQVIESRAWYDVDDDHDGGNEDSDMIYDINGTALGTLDDDGRLDTSGSELGAPVSYARVG